MNHTEVFEEVPVEKLRWSCSPESLPFESSEEVEVIGEFFGQERAVRAIALGLAVEGVGYNVFVTGLTGGERIESIERLLRKIGPPRGPLSDICCVHNFRDPDTPRILFLAAGQGVGLRKDIDEFIESLRKNVPQIFESEEYRSRRKAITESFRERQKAIIKDFERKVSNENFSIIQVQMGPFTRPAIVPVVMGNPMPLEQVEALVEKGEYPRETYERLVRMQAEFAAELENIFSDLQKKEKDFEEKMKSLDKELVSPLVRESVELIGRKYSSEKLRQYLSELTEDLLNNFSLFLPRREKEGQAQSPSPAPELLTEYQVNVLVDNSKTDGIPIIVERNPNYRNVFGGIERILDPRFGVWRTDFSRIKAGSLLAANGGYLVLNFMDVILEPGVWHALKRVLKNRSVEVQSFDPFYVFTMSTLKPEPIPLDVKVILVGDNQLYYLLLNLDEDFREIFKVKADFDVALDNTGETMLHYASQIVTICKEKNLLPVDRTGMAALFEYAVRLAGRQKKISSKFSRLTDVLLEAQYWAKDEGCSTINGAHVDKAIEQRDYRVNLIEAKIQEMIEDGLLMIDTEGNAVGKVNGLSVYDLGDYSFGKPSRITANTAMGRAGIINIEREAELSGKTHDKGVLILSGYLREKYAQNKPLAMSASICFEQSYSGVDGDSASSTEIYAILSSLANLPLRQDVAVTGSLNQKGEVQPIGGVNQKIEGFFDVCRAKGLTGTQGVMIPHQNIGDLMLRKDVVAAVKEKKFHIYPIRTIDEGIELLTGLPAGKRGDDGSYPKGTVNFLVDERLRSLAEGLKTFSEEAPATNKGA